jgi:hypothetical protein
MESGISWPQRRVATQTRSTSARQGLCGGQAMTVVTVVLAVTARHWPVWAALGAATLSWVAISGVAYLLTALLHRSRD